MNRINTFAGIATGIVSVPFAYAAVAYTETAIANNGTLHANEHVIELLSDNSDIDTTQFQDDAAEARTNRNIAAGIAVPAGLLALGGFGTSIALVADRGRFRLIQDQPEPVTLR